MSANLQGHSRNGPPGMILAGMAFLGAGCDAGVEQRALAAAERSARAQALAAPPTGRPGPAEEIITGYMEKIGETSRDYELALAEAGYHDALAPSALASPAQFALGPERIKAAKAAAKAHRDLALAHTDDAIAALKALPPSLRTSGMAEDLAVIRTRRERHWDHAAGIIEETGAAWKTLDRAKDQWAFEADGDGLTFKTLKAKEGYDVHAARIAALDARQKALIAEQEKSAADLTALARVYGR